MIDEPPRSRPITSRILKILVDEKYHAAFEKVEREYLYWDKVKYHSPKGVSPEDFWTAVHYSRRAGCSQVSFGKNCTFLFKETNYMQQLLHEFDMNFGGSISSPTGMVTEAKRQYYLLSSIMEEAIASSQMEGASTTRKVAKEMLKRQLKPKDKSQQMILNNYDTIRFLSEHKDDELSLDLFLEIHRRITQMTLDRQEDEGRFRTDDSIVVADGITGEVAHEPPSYKSIKKMLSALCKFANTDVPYIHPIAKAIIIHFMVSFIHPFVDGNGRTARSLFYWYMLKKGYWLTEFLSISRIIYKSKGQYEKSFLYTEHDDFDLDYFIIYNLTVLRSAFGELKKYLDRKFAEENALLSFKGIQGINGRQAEIIKMFEEKPKAIFVSKDFATTFNVSIKTIRTDLEKLADIELLERLPMNKRLTGYTRGKNFEKRLGEIRGN